jgi:hypothetical protein
MANATLQTEKLLTELEKLYKKRLDYFEDLKFFSLSWNKEQIKYIYGRSVGIKRSIHDILIAFNLTDTELYTKNEIDFELNYLVEREDEIEQTYFGEQAEEWSTSPILNRPVPGKSFKRKETILNNISNNGDKLL